MGRNVKGTKWYATPRAVRARKPLAITLSDEARAKLERLAADTSKSAVVERLVLEAPEPE